MYEPALPVSRCRNCTPGRFAVATRTDRSRQNSPKVISRPAERGNGRLLEIFVHKSSVELSCSPSFHRPTHSHGGFTPPFSRLIGALVRRDRNRGIRPYTGNGRVAITAQFRRVAKKNFQTEVATCTFASRVTTLANERKIFALPGKIFRSCDFQTIDRR